MHFVYGVKKVLLEFASVVQGVPTKTRIIENVKHTQITTFLKESKCFEERNMFNSSQVNKF